MTFKRLRISLLVLILGLVVHAQINDRARIASWDVPLFVAVFPIDADGRQLTAQTIERLRQIDFEPLSEAMAREARRYGLRLDRPVYIELGQQIVQPPPDPPAAGGFFQRAWWVARMRWWLWRFDDQGLDPDIVVLARYHDPQRHPVVPHSVGVENLRVAIANVFSGRAPHGENLVVILHEILHTVGARDKYHLASGLPVFPNGYAEPKKSPLYPQQMAEIMAGRIPLSQSQAVQAPDLDRILIGPLTAAELGWR
ncbi:MAG: hypothetical protein LC637_08955 [Xanthomonadaceae bacterium]|nr:hypothetical protein [Xanthomonadaceae bacterium]